MFLVILDHDGPFTHRPSFCVSPLTPSLTFGGLFLQRWHWHFVSSVFSPPCFCQWIDDNPRYKHAAPNEDFLRPTGDILDARWSAQLTAIQIRISLCRKNDSGLK